MRRDEFDLVGKIQEEAYRKGRLNGIDSLAEKLIKYVYDRDFMSDDVIRVIAEQLKR